ncbi:Cerato-platanin-domain-containing protein [Suillus spraguei]|nr:Cerato-platanin-domain-containing protein [Suillus spraguei]
MKLSSAVVLLFVSALPAFVSALPSATQVEVTYDYLLGSLPSFPNIGGIPYITWNSPLCVTTPTGTQESIYITAIDGADTFNLSEEAFVELTDTSVAAGKVSATATQVAASFCGM